MRAELCVRPVCSPVGNGDLPELFICPGVPGRVDPVYDWWWRPTLYVLLLYVVYLFDSKSMYRPAYTNSLWLHAIGSPLGARGFGVQLLTHGMLYALGSGHVGQPLAQGFEL